MELAQETQESTRQHRSAILRAYIRNNRLTAAGLTLALLSVLILLGQSLAQIAGGDHGAGLPDHRIAGIVVGQHEHARLRRDEAREALGQFIRLAHRTGLRCVRIIHGKGNSNPDRQSILKEKVRRWLKQFDAVVAFAEPYERDGGAGATIVRLKPLPHPSVRNARQNG